MPPPLASSSSTRSCNPNWGDRTTDSRLLQHPAAEAAQAEVEEEEDAAEEVEEEARRWTTIHRLIGTTLELLSRANRLRPLAAYFALWLLQVDGANSQQQQDCEVTTADVLADALLRKRKFVSKKRKKVGFFVKSRVTKQFKKDKKKDICCSSKKQRKNQSKIRSIPQKKSQFS
jgi:hypothetical protein